MPRSYRLLYFTHVLRIDRKEFFFLAFLTRQRGEQGEGFANPRYFIVIQPRHFEFLSRSAAAGFFGARISAESNTSPFDLQLNIGCKHNNPSPLSVRIAFTGSKQRTNIREICAFINRGLCVLKSQYHYACHAD